jgi:hypothetical protein
MDVQVVAKSGESNILVVAEMNNKRIFLPRVICNAVTVSHFGIADDIGDCQFIKTHFSPLREIGLVSRHQNPSVYQQMHVTVMRLPIILYQVSITKDTDT